MTTGLSLYLYLHHVSCHVDAHVYGLLICCLRRARRLQKVPRQARQIHKVTRAPVTRALSAPNTQSRAKFVNASPIVGLRLLLEVCDTVSRWRERSKSGCKRMLPPGDLLCVNVAAARIWLVTKGGLVPILGIGGYLCCSNLKYRHSGHVIVNHVVKGTCGTRFLCRSGERKQQGSSLFLSSAEDSARGMNT